MPVFRDLKSLGLLLCSLLLKSLGMIPTPDCVFFCCYQTFVRWTTFITKRGCFDRKAQDSPLAKHWFGPTSPFVTAPRWSAGSVVLELVLGKLLLDNREGRVSRYDV